MNCAHLVPWALIMALVVGCQRAPEPVPAEAPVKSPAISPRADPQQLAVAAKDAFFERLSARLLAVMSNGGPVKAIEVCSQEASGIATEVGKEFGVSIGRTSFKLRNSRNRPPSWAEPLMEMRPSEPQFVELPGSRTGALLPILLKVQCITCHGPPDQIAADVKQQLTALYPEDEATGFRDGDLRGWFWVEVPKSRHGESARTQEDLNK